MGKSIIINYQSKPKGILPRPSNYIIINLSGRDDMWVRLAGQR